MPVWRVRVGILNFEEAPAHRYPPFREDPWPAGHTLKRARLRKVTGHNFFPTCWESGIAIYYGRYSAQFCTQLRYDALGADVLKNERKYQPFNERIFAFVPDMIPWGKGG